jgi:hypothetical protein
MLSFLKRMTAVAVWVAITFPLSLCGVYADREEVRRYKAVRISDQRSLQQLRSKLGNEAMELIFRVNRIDARHVRKGGELMIPSRFDDPLLHSPFPGEIRQLSGVPKVILVSLFSQAFGAYEAGRLVRWGPTSTGLLKHPTPENLYHANWRARTKVSSLNRSWILRWCVNLHTSMGVSLHQYDMPGYPASQGCIRLLREDAQWIYHWADLWVPSGDWRTALVHGTAVIVFGEYDFSQKPPWRSLAADPRAADVPPGDIDKALGKYSKVIQQRAEERIAYFAASGKDQAGVAEEPER